MRIKSLYLENFMSFRELRYEFDLTPRMVTGRNLTDENQDSNGSGKSTISTAIEFALLNQNSRELNMKHLIRRGTKEAVVELAIECPVRKEVMMIHRGLKKAGSTLEIWINDVPAKFSNVNDGNKFILDWMDMNKDDLISYYLINKTRFKSLFSDTAKGRVSLINRFSNASIIDGVDGMMKKKVDAAEKDIEAKQTEISELQGRIKKLEEIIEGEKNRDIDAEMAVLKQRHEHRIATIKEEIKIQETAKESKLLTLQKYEKDLSEAKMLADDLIKQLGQMSSVSYDDQIKPLEEQKGLVKEEIDGSEVESNKLKQEISKLDSQLSLLNSKLSGMITCPKCHHEFLPSGDEDVSAIRSVKETAENEKIEKSKRYDEVTGMISEFETLMYEVSAEIQKLRSDEYTANKAIIDFQKAVANASANVTKLQSEYDTMSASISRIDQSIENKLENIKELEQQSLPTVTINTEKYEKELADEKESLINKESELTELKDKAMNLREWRAHFTSFKVELSNSSLQVLQDYWNKTLEEIRTDLRVLVEGFKIKSDNTVKEEVTVYVDRNGEINPYGYFSGGEKARVLLASILSVRSLINSTNKYGGLNFLSIDEVLEGTDVSGLSSMIKSISHLKSDILIITHVTGANFQNELTIVKEKGESRIAC